MVDYVVFFNMPKKNFVNEGGKLFFSMRETIKIRNIPMEIIKLIILKKIFQ